MRDHLILLPGWGLGSAPLEPLRDALHEREPHLNVLIEPLPSLDDAADWLDELDDNLPRDSWLAGWSLGGMLAGELAARRGDDCRGLLTLASNPCFRVREDWPNAMPAETFEDFFEAFLLEPHLTRKRFTLLVSQGARDPRTLARQLQVALPQLEREALVAGLQLLGQLDTRAALENFRGPQLHLFAEADALVPLAAAEALLEWLPDVEVSTLAASHGLPLECPDEVAGAILRSSRKPPAATSAARSRWVAQITWISTACRRAAPSGATSPSASTRSRRVCRPSGMSPISSRNRVPPSACCSRPRIPFAAAPVKAPPT